MTKNEELLCQNCFGTAILKQDKIKSTLLSEQILESVQSRRYLSANAKKLYFVFPGVSSYAVPLYLLLTAYVIFAH